jgi:hypothetical protein
VKALVSRHNLAREAASVIGRRVDRRAFVFRMASARLEGGGPARCEPVPPGTQSQELKDFCWVGPARLGEM